MAKKDGIANMLVNLKDCTLKILENCGKTVDDIKWVGCRKYKIPLDKFWELADQYYQNGYGGTEVAEDLIVVGEDWWLERAEYDGSEWWEFKSLPKEPDEIIEPPTLFPKLFSNNKFFYLYEL